MRFMLRDKNGVGMLSPEVIFIVLNLMFFTILFVAVGRTGNAETVYEEAYAKQIALIIDSAKPGTSLAIDVSELTSIAEENKFEPNIGVNCGANNVFIKITETSGYAFSYFSGFKKCDYSLDKQNGILYVRVE